MIKGLFEAKRWDALFQVFPEKYIPGFIMTLKVALTGLLLALVFEDHFRYALHIKSENLQYLSPGCTWSSSRTRRWWFRSSFYYNCLPYVIGGRVPKFALGLPWASGSTTAPIYPVIRTGIEAVPKGQFEAAYSRGFNYLQTMRYIILPQTLKIILPPGQPGVKPGEEHLRAGHGGGPGFNVLPRTRGAATAAISPRRTSPARYCTLSSASQSPGWPGTWKPAQRLPVPKKRKGVA